ncbi:conserved hypothetical protein [Thermanaerovibrio acidaminovorans DSM 6589]|uniref:DUF2905 domain-containing protein n=2 Tax=Thermanaerovibrio TaxID=81461 RepID=D1BA50_THEAS|nr:conserved hypothetical protein [Thermanaerovibrio acidaminovorans DSM 6589]
MWHLGRLIFAMGCVLALCGLAVMLASKLNLPLGRLPGDLVFSRKNVTVFAPFGTMLVVSLVLTLVLNLISRISGR